MSLVVEAHGYVHRVLILHTLSGLFKTFVLQIEAVFEQTFLQEFGDVVESHMDKDGSCERGYHIEDDIQSQGVETHIHEKAKEPHGQ